MSQKIWHPGLGTVKVKCSEVFRRSTWLSLVHNSSGPWFEPRTCQKQKCCLFSSVRTPDITQQQNQLPGCFLVLQHHFLSLPRPSLEKDSRCKGGEKGYGYMPPKGPQTMVETILLWSVRRRGLINRTHEFSFTFLSMNCQLTIRLSQSESISE